MLSQLPTAKKVIFLVTTLGFGGTERNLVQYCESLDRSKWNIEVWYLHQTAENMLNRLQASGIVAKHLDAPKKFRPGYLIRLAHKLANTKADLIHIFLPTVGYYAVASKLLFRSKTPMLFSSGGVQFLLPLQRQMMQYGLGRYCYPIVCNSNAVAKFWREMNVDRQRVRVIPNGHDVTRFEAHLDRESFRKSLDLSDGEFAITIVGRLIDTKRHADLLQALSLIDVAEIPYRLLIVGDGPCLESIVQQAEDLNIRERVSILGRRDDVPTILRCSDLFAFPSASEGLPNAVIEAALCKLPIVASNIEPVLEIVEHDRSARIFPVGDVKQLAKSIELAAKDVLTSKEMAEAAYADAIQSFNLKNTISLLETAYYDAIKGYSSA